MKNFVDVDTVRVPDNRCKIEETLNLSNFVLNEANKNHKPFHTLVLSTTDGNYVNSRVMVMRQFNSDERTIYFHTDFRSPKIHDIEFNKNASVIGYCSDLKTQIKLHGTIEVNYDNEITKNAWDNMSEFSRKSYTNEGVPSDTINYLDKKHYRNDGYNNFAVMIFTYTSLEFLFFLKHSGHIRARHTWDSDNILKSSWLFP
ncbi:hypothetical protein CPAV1605_1362 [seawater metagenome]|uniref:Pyridoxamine 5'-phosphate oxidase Alr4036 family FMN-binding domain-containing protein n=1 Tax=seawater metagenome TaxID=1561972 RepID=A0A5E8CMJ1_9ZZZZ